MNMLRIAIIFIVIWLFLFAVAEIGTAHLKAKSFEERIARNEKSEREEETR